jgi:poly(3-hydroxyalkanoate) depolymerase
MNAPQFVELDGLRLRYSVAGRGRPLLLLNGIGAALELLEPLRTRLPGIESLAVDMPGTGGSQTPRWPLLLRQLAHRVDRLLDVLGYQEIDVLGISWGGTLAQELARRHPARVGKLVLAATAPGWTSIPGRPTALRLLATPRRYRSPTYFASIAERLYGGSVDADPHLLHEQGLLRLLKPPSTKGYFWQLAALTGWTSLPWLHRLRMPTLVLAGDRDPIVPLANARLMACRLPRATLEVVRGGGHLFLLTHAATVGPMVARFLLG